MDILFEKAKYNQKKVNPKVNPKKKPMIANWIDVKK